MFCHRKSGTSSLRRNDFTASEIKRNHRNCTHKQVPENRAFRHIEGVYWEGTLRDMRLTMRYNRRTLQNTQRDTLWNKLRDILRCHYEIPCQTHYETHYKIYWEIHSLAFQSKNGDCIAPLERNPQEFAPVCGCSSSVVLRYRPENSVGCDSPRFPARSGVLNF